MSKELRISHRGEEAVYAVIRAIETGTVFSTVASALVAWDDADYADYAIALEDLGGGYRAADLPSGMNASTPYQVEYYKQAGAAPAMSDELIGTEESATAADTPAVAGELTAGEVISVARAILMDDDPIRPPRWSDEILLTYLADGQELLLTQRADLRRQSHGIVEPIAAPTALTDALSAPASRKVALADYVVGRARLELNPDKTDADLALLHQKLFAQR